MGSHLCSGFGCVLAGKTVKPKFTDEGKFRVPYVPANQTDIRRTFERVRADLEAQRNRNVLKLNEAIDRRKKR